MARYSFSYSLRNVMIGERISARLRELGMSQSELARRVGLTQGSIAQLVSGRSRSSAHIHKIARELKTTPAFLSGETNDSTSDQPDNHLTSEEVDLLVRLRALSAEDRMMVMQITKKLAGRPD